MSKSRTKLLDYLERQEYLKTYGVRKAMEKVDRESFVRTSDKASAYDDTPLSIGQGQTISAPHMVAMMLEELMLEKEDNLLQTVEAQHKTKSLNCVLVDEAQFLTRDQVIQLGNVVDRLEIPVLCYGLRTDFLGELFEGSRSLLAWADELREIKTVCHCGKKAIMTVRLNEEGKPLQAGEQIQIGGNESYVSMCRRHFKSSLGLSEI